ncbi:replication-associated recombination protein A [Phorcysia thermohydrogeniphila]|uniref:replication-associated recombination protein A n=1 Tax=Phorcysia thermohydrogeniphila TaxID=936138 RepID=UPI0031F2FF0A
MHRFNKAQQDALLPDVEAGNVILIGASTENPYFSLTPALRSRVKIYEFKPLSSEELRELYRLAVTDRRGLPGFKVPSEVLDHLIRCSSGDGRKFLTYLEELYELTGGKEPDIALAEELTEKASIRYGKGDDHYDVISAFIKSIRGSDPDAALYYLAKMLVGGEDPVFIARRLVILASEDIGNANPEALLVATAALQAVEKVGMPEAAINLAQAVIYLSMSLKSNAVYKAIKKAIEDVESGVELPVPDHLRSGFKNRGYRYPHDYPRHWVEQDYLVEKRKYYESSGIGFEKQLEEWLKWMKGEG